MQYNLITDLENRQADIHDRGLHYGDGLFETMLLKDGKIALWNHHFQRLFQSASRLGIACPDREWFDQQLDPYLKLDQDLVIKIILVRGSGGRGLTLPDELSPNIYIFHYPYNESYKNQYIKAMFSDIPLPRNKHLAGLKHLNRLDYVLATRALKKKPDYNEAILCDNDGFIVEGIVHNIFFVINDELCTPKLSNNGVDGIFRQMILSKMIQINRSLRTGYFSKQDLVGASECFFCNSVQGIRPVIKIEHTEFETGPLTLQLQQEFHGVAGH